MKRVFIFYLLSLLCCGCVFLVPTQSKRDINLVLLEQATELYIQYIQHRRTRTDSGQLGVVVDIRNIHPRKDIAVDWKMVFYDKERFEIEPTAWNTVVVPKQQKISLKTTCMSDQCVDFKLYIRDSKN